MTELNLVLFFNLKTKPRAKLINADYKIYSVSDFFNYYLNLTTILSNTNITGELKERLINLLNNPGLQTGSCGVSFVFILSK